MSVVIIIVISFLDLCSSTRILTSSELENLFVKHAKNEIMEYEFKTIQDLLRIFRHIWDSPLTVSKGIRCFMCRSVFAALITIIKIGLPDEQIIHTGNKLCSIVISARLCRGSIKLYFPILKYIILTTSQATPKTFCGILLQNHQDSNICAYDDPRFTWQIKLPPKPEIQLHSVSSIHHDQSPLAVAVLSDIHIDPFYEPFGTADCDEPVCCRKGQKPRSEEKPFIDEIAMKNCVIEIDEEIFLDMDAASKILHYKEGSLSVKSPPAGYWGDYRNCDTPVWALRDVIEKIASHKGVDVVYYIGDTIDHHIWEATHELNEYENNLTVNTMKEFLGNRMIVIPAIGNHEAQPANQFAPMYVKGEGLNTTWIYKSLADKWSYYLTKKASDSMKQKGGFSMMIRPGLRVISINNNVAYKYNFWLLHDPLVPKMHLKWLVDELYQAEFAGEKVHILSHVPPGDQDLIYIWTREYHRIIDRFSSTITAQFNGHLHSDEFKVFYKDSKAFNVAWGAGSATTYQNFNLNYKIVSFDNTKFEPTNIVNYIYNLTEANLTPHQRPRWYELYDMKTSFQLQNLSAAAMDQLMHRMVRDEKHLLDMYVTFSSKASDAMPNCDTRCKLEMLCNAVTSVLWHRDMCDELTHLYFS